MVTPCHQILLYWFYQAYQADPVAEEDKSRISSDSFKREREYPIDGFSGYQEAGSCINRPKKNTWFSWGKRKARCSFHWRSFSENASHNRRILLGSHVYSLKTLLTSLDRQLRIKQMVCQTSVIMECWWPGEPPIVPRHCCSSPPPACCPSAWGRAPLRLLRRLGHLDRCRPIAWKIKSFGESVTASIDLCHNKPKLKKIQT